MGFIVHFSYPLAWRLKRGGAGRPNEPRHRAVSRPAEIAPRRRTGQTAGNPARVPAPNCATATRFGDGALSLLDRVRRCRQWDRRRYRPFLVGAERVGWVRHPFALRLRRFPEAFRVGEEAVSLAPGLDDFEARSAAVARVLECLRVEGLVPGWRAEAYPVAASFDARPLLRIERAAVPLFGVQGYGVHLNGYVGRGADMRLWVARRSASKPTGPGKLDHIVAGGQPVGLGLMENLVKECAEEASMPAELAGRARPAGFVSYITENPEGLRHDVLFAYDLELPAEFVPENADGEIEEFFLWPIERVAQRLADSDDFKFNVALVVIDFLVRHGFIGPEERHYIDIVEGLRLGPAPLESAIPPAPPRSPRTSPPRS